jgi:hypothetical protein
MTGKIEFTFDKTTISKCIVELLSKGLVDDTENPVFKLTFEECLKVMTQGKKLQNAPANYLLYGLMRALSIEDSPIEDEIPPEGLQEVDLGKDQSLSQSVAAQSTSASAQEKTSQEVPSPKSGQKPDLEQKKKKEVCRFYARGHCTRKKDCRFDHPSVCPKFRQFGSVLIDTKGCDGKCGAFHPNACRSSLRDRTCSWKECRFWHLKGTKSTNRDGNPNQNSNQGRSNGQNNQNKKNQDQGRNRFQVLGSDNKLNQNQNHNQSQKKNNNKKNQVFQQDKAKLNSTLEAIMNRLSAMESRQSMYPVSSVPMHLLTQVHPGQQAQQVQPLLSPAVPQPGSQTQGRWNSPIQWSQTQSQ